MTKSFFSVMAVSLCASVQAYASDEVAGHAQEALAHGAAAHEKTGGLPQLDPSSFSSQIFWLLVVFSFLYMFFSKKTLPDVSNVIENRRERVQNDLDTAHKLKEDVASVQESYEHALSEARVKASGFYKKAEDATKEKAEKSAKDFQDKASAQIETTTKNITKAVDAAMAELNTISCQVAMQAAQKIIGVSVDADYAKAVVEGLNSPEKNKSAKAA